MVFWVWVKLYFHTRSMNKIPFFFTGSMSGNACGDLSAASMITPEHHRSISVHDHVRIWKRRILLEAYPLHFHKTQNPKQKTPFFFAGNACILGGGLEMKRF